MENEVESIEVAEQPLISSPKKKLRDAQQQDAYFEREGKAAETQHITRQMSEVFVVKAMTAAIENVGTVAKNE